MLGRTDDTFTGGSRMDTHSILGMMHAEEALLVSIVRSLPADIKRTIANDFHEQVELAETSHLNPTTDREASDAFKAHMRRLSNMLASLS
nr:hypothetical protein [Paraburkholderia ribeironis]